MDQISGKITAIKT